MKLIVNADDFGLTDGVTFGILSAMEHGIVTSTTMMVNMPGTQTAAEIARKVPTLAIGLRNGRPLQRGRTVFGNARTVQPLSGADRPQADAH